MTDLRSRIRTARRTLAALLLVAGAASALEVPFLAGPVNDLAGLLDAEGAGRLEEKLRAAEQKTGAQVAVLTIDSLEGEALEEYAYRVASTWRLGRADLDNGVLFLVAKSDRRMRIEVGRGLEPALTDAECGRILEHLARPAFRAGDFGGGLEAAVDAILGQLDGTGTVPEAPPVPRPSWGAIVLLSFLFVTVIGLFSGLAVIAPGGVAWLLYFFLMPFDFLLPSAVHPKLGPLVWAAWTVAFPVLRLVLRHSRSGKAWTARHSWVSAMSTGWSSGGSSSGSSGGYSGGGGSFGGGGASSSW